MTGLLVAAGSPAAASPMFMGLGTLPSPYAFSSFAAGVSGDGSVVVGSSQDQFRTTSKAFRWTASGGMVGLGSSPDPSVGKGVSADGSTVVGDFFDQAWRWTETGGFQELSAPGVPLINSYGASSDGSVIAANMAIVVRGVTIAQAHRWTSATGPVGLGYLPGHTLSRTTGISGDGSVLVGFSTAGIPGIDPTEAFRWTSVGGMLGLGDLPGGASHSQANAVSADGSVVVGYSSSASGNEAFRWTSADGMLGLGDLPGGGFDSNALAVSADGSVVVGYDDSNGGSTQDGEPFIWDSTHGMRNLTTVLVELGLDLTGWDLSAATGISADGLTIVGDGFNSSGAPEAWIAVIPEPGTGLLAMAGLLGLAGWRRRIGRLAQ